MYDMPRKKLQKLVSFSSTPQRTSAFTLIELMIVIMIMSGIFVTGIVRYRDFQRRQALEAAARTIISELRYAQEQAIAGKKPATCDTLRSYVFQRISSTSYRVVARCTADIVVSTTNQTGFASQHPGITIGAFSEIVFNVLGKGVGNNINITLTQANTNATRAISITTGGEIK